jgi:hypothetical protein
MSKLDGFAGKDCELFWITGELEHQKFQITNIKQITMTKIVRAWLGLPTLGTRPQGGESGGPILEFEICLKFGSWNLGFHKPPRDHSFPR